MEGILLVPPDRGSILGRAVWKSRYVVIGPLLQKDSQPNLSLSHVLSAARIREVGGWSSKSQQKTPTDTIYLSIYKNKEDTEPIQQYSIASITDCQVQQVKHRKQVLPTLAVQIAPETTSDKLRKRRSSRAGGLIATKETGPVTLWFLTAEESRHGLGEWARYIQVHAQQQRQSMPTSPNSPLSPAFISPFPPIQDANENPSPASSAKGKLLSKFQTKSSSRPHPPTREHHSGSASLRSRKSDLSSHASSMRPAAMNFVQQHYANLQHSELPSPTTTLDEQPEQFIEGWTTAQGRSSALSSPIRGRGSISSSQGVNQPSIDSSPVTIPRETILDRAFQMRCIPGSDRELAGDEKLTSLARFEALMNEVEGRRKSSKKEATEHSMRSTWEEDDESDNDGFRKEVKDEEDNGDKEEDSDSYAFEDDEDRDEMDASTFKALQFITNRHSSTYSDSGLTGGPSILRPHTAHSQTRPMASRTISQPYIPGPPLQIPSSPPSRQMEEFAVRPTHTKRRSTSDMKNLGLHEFAERLSGSSSLLLVQSNTSTGSNRGSDDFTPRGSMSPREARETSMTPSEREERCRWRGSIGVFGNEGGFL